VTLGLITCEGENIYVAAIDSKRQEHTSGPKKKVKVEILVVEGSGSNIFEPIMMIKNSHQIK
jgi:hypothetical protein